MDSHTDTLTPHTHTHIRKLYICTHTYIYALYICTYNLGKDGILQYKYMVSLQKIPKQEEEIISFKKVYLSSQTNILIFIFFL